jgi:hypothetical protein
MRRCGLLALVVIAACDLFGLSSSQPEAGGAGAVPNTQAAAGAQDQELAAQLDRLDAEIRANGATADRAVKYAELSSLAHESGAVQRGAVYGPTVVRSGLAHVTAAKEKQPERMSELLVAEGRLELIRGQPEKAVATHLQAVQNDPRPDYFWLLAALPNAPGQYEAVIGVCPSVRPNVTPAEVPQFVGVCLAAANGERAALTWEGAKADLKAYDVELKRQEEERLRREEEERLAREEEARLAAEAAKKAQGYAAAAVFAAGRCEFGDCAKNGWTTRTDDGDVRTRCSFSKCLENGWETTFPDGSRATTRCSFSKCLENGWETSFPDGSRATTRCSFGKCATDGWETSLPDGSRSTTRCKFSKCFENGWDTNLPTGGSVSCNCSFSDCLGNGAECG